MRILFHALLIVAALIALASVGTTESSAGCYPSYSSYSYSYPTYSSYSYPTSYSYSAPVYSAPTYYPQVIEKVKVVEKEVPVAYPVPFTVAVPVASYLYNGATYAPAVAQPAVAAGQVMTQAAAAPAAAAAPCQQVQQVQTPCQQAAAAQAQVQQAQVQQVQTQTTAAPAMANTAQAPRANYNAQGGHPQLSDAQLDQLILRIEGRLRQRAPAQAPPPPRTLPPPVPQTESYQGSTNPNQVSLNQSNLEAQVYSILTTKRGTNQKSCMDCHTGALAQGGTRLFETGGALSASIPWQKVVEEVDAARMPLEARTNQEAALTDQEVAVLRGKAAGG